MIQKLLFLNWKENIPTNYTDFLEFKDENIVLFPPFTVLHIFAGKINIGGQNVSNSHSGPFTGEISAEMLKFARCKYAIVGHSERRMSYYETLDQISQKVVHCIANQIVPVLCIGENLKARQDSKHFDKIRDQLTSFQSGCIIAYEPIWAIGSGLKPTNNEISEMSSFIRQNTDSSVKVLYGGSVNPANIHDIYSIDNIDGVLVGGSSLLIDHVRLLQQGNKLLP